MTDAQIFQVLGIMYLAVGIGIITSRDFYNKIFEGFMDSPPAFYLGGLVALVIGYLLIAFHNIWVKDWPVIITIIGWIALIKGILLIAFPKVSINISRCFIGTKKILTIWAIVAIILGVLCCWLGFFVMSRPAI